ncbi:MAG: peptidoglycan DD-metalloendopeptidase family protein [Balneolaceae bacterium]|nr:peptidoglycan DD-metalloendopeptidase family protein [Balneolaceae bacterium]
MALRSFPVLFMMILFFPIMGFGQTSYDYLRDQLMQRQDNTRSQISNLDRQIQAVTERLNEVSREYDEVFRQYEELNRLIVLQQERLRQMNREQGQIEEEIQLIEDNLTELEEQLNLLIEQYKDTLTYIYKHGRTTELALILTSTSLNQLMVRSFYLSRFNDHLQSQVDEIETTQERLVQSRRDLEQTHDRNRESLANIRSETDRLEQQQNRQEEIVQALQSDINGLENQRNLRQQQRDNLENTMENLIREEERLRRAEASGATPVVRENMVSEDELGAFEESFREQRGQLPWPVDNGTITERFGERIHPVYNTRTQNLGVDIAAMPGSSVRAVNDGYVYGVQNLQGYGEVIFVSHGEYKTAYGNMSDIFVRRNQVLRKGDVIGLSGDENSIRGPVVFFLIREGSQMVDPERWLQNPQP